MSDGIQDAVKAFHAALVVALDTNDTAAFEQVTTPGCPCRGLLKQSADLAKKGEHYTAVSITVTRIRVHDLIGGAGSAEVWYKIDPGVLVDAAGRALATATDSPNGHVDMFLVYFHGHWLVANDIDMSVAQ